MLGRPSKCKGWILQATLECVQKKKIYLKTLISPDFKFLQKVGMETLKFLFNTINQLSQYLLSAYCLQGPMISMKKDKYRIGHVPRELAHFNLKKKDFMLEKEMPWNFSTRKVQSSITSPICLRQWNYCDIIKKILAGYLPSHCSLPIIYLPIK